MIGFDGRRLADESGAQVVAAGPQGPPARAVVDSRLVGEGDLFVGLPGENVDGGGFAEAALQAGAWGVLVGPKAARSITETGAWVLGAEDPLLALQRLATAWRRELGCAVVGITGSTGKTSVKDICRAILPGSVHASPENFNTEIGMPLAMLAAPAPTDVLVLEMGMRGPGQIAELCAIAEPDVGAITNVGPVHLELLGSIEAIAAAKAEILAGLRPGGRGVVPAELGLLEPHLERGSETISFGPQGDVSAAETVVGGGETDAVVVTPLGQVRFRFPFTEAHNLSNALCAIAIGIALGSELAELAGRTSQIVFSRLRGELLELAEGVVVINDSYNANPISMHAALDHLSSLDATGNRIAVLGGMHELGPEAAAFHRDVAAYARRVGVDAIVGVGELAREYEADEWVAAPEDAVAVADRLIGPGDVVLVKGSRAVGLERFADGLAAVRGSG